MAGHDYCMKITRDVLVNMFLLIDPPIDHGSTFDEGSVNDLLALPLHRVPDAQPVRQVDMSE